jgi:Spy/CpxP family protein refolding chaperone
MHGGGGDDGGAFGVRRPLRHLAHRLSLDERQTAEVARILDELKTERAQVAVDERRTVSAFADALEADAFDAAKLDDAAAARVRSSERLKSAVVKALGRIHALLDPEQRKQFAFLVRTGAVQF